MECGLHTLDTRRSCWISEGGRPNEYTPHFTLVEHIARHLTPVVRCARHACYRPGTISVGTPASLMCRSKPHPTPPPRRLQHRASFHSVDAQVAPLPRPQVLLFASKLTSAILSAPNHRVNSATASGTSYRRQLLHRAVDADHSRLKGQFVHLVEVIA